MRYIIDHDIHIHSQLSTCSSNPEQTPENILAYAEKNGLKTICLTDHFWDEDVEGARRWYAPQNYQHVCKSKPLPQSENVSFLFGCETEMDSNFNIAITLEHFDNFDFVIIPTTHMHMIRQVVKEEDFENLEKRAKLWVDRLDALLNLPLPFHKVGIAHLACEYVGYPLLDNFLKAYQMIPDSEMERLFTKAAEVGVGIEINADDVRRMISHPDIVLRPFRIAKEKGCKFYMGSDAHGPAGFEHSIELFEKVIDLLDLKESDKFIIRK